MGLGNNRGNLTFVNISEGLFYTGKKADGKTFTDLTGIITDLELGTDTYDGKTFEILNITVVDADGNYKLKLRFESGYARCFCNMIENIDLSAQVVLAPKWEKGDGTKPGKGSLFMIQHGKPIKHRYTKAEPGDLPQLEKVSFKGQDMWDNTKQQKYYREMLMERIKPNLQPAILAGPASDINKNGAPAAATSGSVDKPMDAAHITEPVDDLPF